MQDVVGTSSTIQKRILAMIVGGLSPTRLRDVGVVQIDCAQTEGREKTMVIGRAGQSREKVGSTFMLQGILWPTGKATFGEVVSFWHKNWGDH